MQKLKQELNANVVGANCVRPHFEEMTLKNQKGITLIALIITIIVMLILVGVTINVALNGGLFQNAEDAAEQTQIASEKEQLMMAALGAYDVETGVDFANMELPEIFEGSNGTYTSKETGKTYTVNQETAEITEGTSQKVEYFRITRELEEGKECVYAFDYTNKIMKAYKGNIGEELICLGSENMDIIENYDKEFYIIENGERVDIGTGAIKILTFTASGDVSDMHHFIINGKFYMDAVENGTTTALAEEIPNFDITRLVEE